MRHSWHSGLGLRYPVVQAGMGGGLSTARLAIAVSLAGGLGTLGILPPDEFKRELKLCRSDCQSKPFAANLLMPFVRKSHVDACLAEHPAVVVMFQGFDASLVRCLQQAGIKVWHQIGNADQAKRALADGVDGLVVQGVEAGGHLGGDIPLAELLPVIRQLVSDKPLIAAGGIFNTETAATVRKLEADGVAAGTRFLMTPESNAHPDYLQCLLQAETTLRTKLFGMAWPAWHRVVPNAATKHWCRKNPEGPFWLRALNTFSIPLRYLLPMKLAFSLTAVQRPNLPLFTPASKTQGTKTARVDSTALYAGECVNQIKSLRPAAEIVEELAKGFAD
jgi:NAD(P)H-dependent flavin oxidoreductase YrpB (nitropropane dioxygenase family)